MFRGLVLALLASLAVVAGAAEARPEEPRGEPVQVVVGLARPRPLGTTRWLAGGGGSSAHDGGVAAGSWNGGSWRRCPTPASAGAIRSSRTGSRSWLPGRARCHGLERGRRRRARLSERRVTRLSSTAARGGSARRRCVAARAHECRRGRSRSRSSTRGSTRTIRSSALQGYTMPSGLPPRDSGAYTTAKVIVARGVHAAQADLEARLEALRPRALLARDTHRRDRGGQREHLRRGRTDLGCGPRGRTSATTRP